MDCHHMQDASGVWWTECGACVSTSHAVCPTCGGDVCALPWIEGESEDAWLARRLGTDSPAAAGGAGT